MAYWDQGTGTGGVLRLDMNETGTDVGSNTSTVHIVASIYTPSGSFHSNADLSVSLSGDVSWNTGTWSFSSGGGWKTLYDGYVTRGHNADGTGSISVNFSLDEYTGTSGVAGPTATGAKVLTLSTIPRASTATFSPDATFDAGAAVTINTNWASSGFTHDITYNFGTASGTVATAVGASTSWTPPLTLLTQIPNATSGNGYITVNTKNGGTSIGTKTTAFTLVAPATAVPSISSLTLSDLDTAVVTNVGLYVQNLTDLKCIVNSAGYQGSTIVSSVFSVSGGNAASGGSVPLTTSGTVAVLATVTDSRGRVKTLSQNITVLAYTTPAFASYQVIRCTSAGIADDNGTYLKVILNASVKSLINSTEKNTLTINTFTRVRGTTPWTARNVIAHTAVSYNSNYLISGGAIFPINTSFEVRVDIVDKFNTSAAQTTVATATVLMNLSATGVGVGKYHEYGTLDVNGTIYATDVAVTGGYTPIVVTDWNTAMKAGFYGSNNTATNGPFAWWWKAVVVAQGSELIQILHGVGYEGMQFTRTYSSSTWSKWKTTGRAQGTASQRNTVWGNPATDANRVALANMRPTWFNTDTGWEESYFAVTGLAGLTAPGVKTGYPSQWYPISGIMPAADIRNHAATMAISNNAPTVITSYTVGTLGYARSVTVSSGALTIQVPGRYVVQGSYVLAGVWAAGGRLAQITLNNALDAPQSYIMYGPYHPGQTLMYEPIDTVPAEIDLEVGDVLRLMAWQNSGAATALAKTTDAVGLGDVSRIGNFFRARYLNPPLA